MLLKNTLHVLHSACVVLFVSGGIERLEKTDLACILVLVDCLPNHSLLRLAESDLQLVHGSKLGYWGQWIDERLVGGVIRSTTQEVRYSSLVTFYFWGEIDIFLIFRHLKSWNRFLNQALVILWLLFREKKWWSHGNKVPVLKHECLHRMLRLTDTYGSWYR